MHQSRVYIICGGSSVGKTSTARALQDLLLPEPSILQGVDMFHLAIPPAKLNLMQGDSDYLDHNIYTKDGKAYFEVLHGHIMTKIDEVRYHAILEFLKQGISVVADEVLWKLEEVKHLLRILKGKPVYLFALHISDEEAKRREMHRSGGEANFESNFRPEGIYRASVEAVHRYMQYDLEIDGTNLTPIETAKVIINALQAGLQPNAFSELCHKHLKN